VEVLSLPVTVEGSDVLRRVVAGYLARYKGLSRSHTESDLRCSWAGAPNAGSSRGAAHLAGRACPPTQRATRVANPRPDPHLQFEAMLTAARESGNPNDFALVAMLGLLGLRIFEATGADITDFGEEHGHRVLKVHGKGDRIVLVPLPPAVGHALDRVRHLTDATLVPSWRTSSPAAIRATTMPRLD
jgi:integrase/recombinase XerD